MQPSSAAAQRPQHPQHFNSLPDSVIVRIFLKLAPNRQRRELQAVCKRWRAICDSEDASELWEAVQISQAKDFGVTACLPRMYAWFLAKAPLLRQLDVDVCSAAAWPPICALLGLVGPRLAHLRLYGDEDGAYEPGGAVPWLTLTPRLQSLELENACDAGVDAAAFPPGLTHLALNHCGEEGLYCLPAQLPALAQLRSLEVQGSLFDNPLATERLALCTSIECLDLTNCCLEVVPPALAALSRLSRLTLNTNPGLGEEARPADQLAVLSLLTSLRYLEMRECALAAAPPSIAALPGLRTLLLGCNDMGGRPVLPPGAWMAQLRLLGMSDAEYFQEPTPVEVVARPLLEATGLEVLRLNRNPGLRLGLPQIAALLRGKPRLRQLQLSEAMLAGGADVTALAAAHPRVAFRLLD